MTKVFVFLWVSVSPWLVYSQNSAKADKLCKEARLSYLQFTAEGYKDAADLYRKAVKEDSGSAMAYAGLAETYALMGFESERSGRGAGAQETYNVAFNHAKKAIAIDPRLAAAHRAFAQVLFNMDSKTHGERIHDELMRAVELDSLDADTYYLLWLHTENDKPESPLIRVALRLNENFFQAHYALGQLYARLKQFDKAVESYKKCVAINPKNFRPFFSLGNAYSQQAKFDLAAMEYETAIKLNKSLADAYFYLGVAYYNTGKNKDAKKNLEKYLELNPTSTYRTQVDGILKAIK